MITLPYPHPLQVAVLTNPARFKVLACGRRWGKTTMALIWAVERAIRGRLIWWVLPTFPMSTEVWRILKTATNGAAEKRESERRIEFPGGGAIQVKSADNPDSLRGAGLDGVVIDEAAMISDAEAWQAALRPALADRQGEALLLSTPKGQNWFYEEWQRGYDAAAYPDYASFHYKTAESLTVPASEIQAAERELPPRVFAQEFEASFEGIGAPEKFMPSMAWWDACLESLPQLDRSEPLVLAVDAGVVSDAFAVVGVTRHPEIARAQTDVAVRLVAWWYPGGQPLDFAIPEAHIREIISRWNVAQIAYDKYQLHDMMTRLSGLVWTKDFSQGEDRLTADKRLFDLIMNRHLAHDGHSELRKHIDNADRKMDADMTRMRIVKRKEEHKVDLAVALSMAAHECLRLNL